MNARIETNAAARRRALRSIAAGVLAAAGARAQAGGEGTPAAATAATAETAAADGNSRPAPAPGRPPGHQRGRVSFYGKRFAQRATASGELFEPEALTMAHRSLPFGATVKVTNLRNRRSVIVRVTDRGPHLRSRIADVSLGAARVLGMLRHGVIDAHLEVVALGGGVAATDALQTAEAPR